MAKKRTDITEDIVRTKYLIERKSRSVIAKELHCGETLIYNVCKKFSIPARSRSESLKGRTFTYDHRLKLSANRSNRPKGKDNPNWRGGISIDHTAIRRRADYTAFRRTVLSLKGNVCQQCDKRLREPCPNCGHVADRHVHHLQPFSTHTDLRLSIQNAVVLCESCHRTQHHK